MEKLLKNWIKWKKERKECVCIQKDNPDYKSGMNVIILHQEFCPSSPVVRTDIGKFIDWLAKENN